MYDYFRDLGRDLTSEQLIEVFTDIAVLNNTPFCKDWVELLSVLGPQNFLHLTQVLGGRTFTLPPLYQVLMVIAALMVIEKAKTVGYDAAKKEVIGGLVLDGFDELASRLQSITGGDSKSPSSERDATI